jgi:hypothetical protein
MGSQGFLAHDALWKLIVSPSAETEATHKA